MGFGIEDTSGVMFPEMKLLIKTELTDVSQYVRLKVFNKARSLGRNELPVCLGKLPLVPALVSV